MASQAPSPVPWVVSRKACGGLRLYHNFHKQTRTSTPSLQDQVPTDISSLLGMERSTAAPNIQCAWSPDDQLMSRRLNRKIDIALLPFLSMLYLFNGLDRSNVGNAETQGL